METNKPLFSPMIIIGLVVFIPTLFLIFGYLLFPPSVRPIDHPFVFLPLFLGLVLLGIGALLKQRRSHLITLFGWGLFTLFWSFMPSFLYASEGGDVFNAAVCIIGVYVLFYMAYHEWLSYERDETVSCLQWIAGGTALAGLIYFTVDTGIVPQLRESFIQLVASHSTAVLHLLSLPAQQQGSMIFLYDNPITIIFACTAIQSMVLFVGMIAALRTVSLKRKMLGIFVTVVPIYFLNLLRNAGVIWMVASGFTSFHMAHNVIAKIGSLLALIALLFLVFKIVPELFDEIMCLFDLSKREGPIENLFNGIKGKKKQ